MQVRDHRNGEVFRCTRGRDDYTPPRLQGLPFRDHDRTPDDDAFGLAVLVFKTTMNGVHPFSSTADPGQERNTTLADKIRREYFPYNESGLTPTEHQPSRPYQEAWQDAPFSLRHLFRRAFDPDATRTGPPANAGGVGAGAQQTGPHTGGEAQDTPPGEPEEQEPKGKTPDRSSSSNSRNSRAGDGPGGSTRDRNIHPGAGRLPLIPRGLRARVLSANRTRKAGH